MRQFYFKATPSLSLNQKISLIIASTLVIMFSFILAVKHQHTNEYKAFNHKINTLIQQQEQNEQNQKTILLALTQYYTSNSIKSQQEFEHFAQGLFQHSKETYAVGFAHYLPQARVHNFEQKQQRLGFESFVIKGKGLFVEEDNTPHNTHLAVDFITPFDPERSIFLGQDLLSFPDIRDKLADSIAFNKPFSTLMQSKIDHLFYNLTLQPSYLSNPVYLGSQERKKLVKGMVFIVTELEKAFVKKLTAQFPNHSVQLELDTPLVKGRLFQTLLPDAPSTLEIYCPFNCKIQRQLNITPSLDSTRTTIVRQWGWQDINLAQALLISLVSLTIFLVLVSITILTLRYTRSLQYIRNRLVQIISTSQDAIIVTNKLGYIKVWNPLAEKVFGYTKEEAMSQCMVSLLFEKQQHSNPTDLHHEQSLYDIFKQKLNLSGDMQGSQKVELQLFNKARQPITLEIAVSILRSSELEDDFEISLFIKDITHQRQTEAEIKQLAYFDPLTSLQNRTYFKSLVEEAISEQVYTEFSILFLDLDGFKEVNDSLGHGVGDELLKVISKRLTHTLRSAERDTHICRFGGDEFIFMLGGVGEQDITNITLRLLNQIQRLIKIETDELHVTGSIGIAIYPQHGTDVDTLLRHADTAMYQAKNSGKNTLSVYHESMEAELSRRLLIDKHLRHALKLNEFSLVYQPQLDLSNNQVVGVEALIRWNNPVLGFVPPDEFISIAEESHLIITIGDWVAKTCIQQLKAWKNTPFNTLHIAINVSSKQLQHPNFVEAVRKLMDNAHLPTHLLELELTERTVMSNAHENIALFNDIREQGFGLSVDDFGTGYSSLSYLKKFPLSILKIDKSFIDGLPNDDEDVSIARAILSLSHSLNMQVVAEGVETADQLDFLRELNCDFVQGYYISRPLDITRLEEWMIAYSEKSLKGLPNLKPLENHHERPLHE